MIHFSFNFIFFTQIVFFLLFPFKKKINDRYENGWAQFKSITKKQKAENKHEGKSKKMGRRKKKSQTSNNF